MLFQNRLVFFGLYLLKLVADNHRLTAEHAVELLDTGLEQGLCVIANRSRVGARHALPFEHKLEHSFASLFLDRKSTRLNSSHVRISYAVFCLKKKINST